MEHRWNRRVNVGLHATLYHAGTPVASCRTRDISLDGMFVRACPNNFPRHTPVDVELTLHVSGERRRYRLPAVVVHNRDEGLGLMFVTFDTEPLGYIQSLVSNEEAQDKRSSISL